jgi:hypothetical protein
LERDEREDMLTKKDILLILERIGEQTVVEPSKGFPYRVSCRASGYSDDKSVRTLQAKLSIMLEAAR